MNHPKTILATITVALTLAAVPTARAAEVLIPPEYPVCGIAVCEGFPGGPTPPAPGPVPEPECGGVVICDLQPAVRTPVPCNGIDLPCPQPDPIVIPEPPCQEDEPCWDCATMGNRICGPVLGVLPVTL